MTVCFVIRTTLEKQAASQIRVTGFFLDLALLCRVDSVYDTGLKYGISFAKE